MNIIFNELNNSSIPFYIKFGSSVGFLYGCIQARKIDKVGQKALKNRDHENDRLYSENKLIVILEYTILGSLIGCIVGIALECIVRIPQSLLRDPH